MAISRLVAPSGASVQPVGGTGTYTLSVALTPGLYKITTDTVQSFSAAQLYFETAQGFRFGAVIRGGQGFVAIPLTVTTVTFTTGTFPLLIGFERFSSYSLAPAPSNVTFTYTTPVSPFGYSITMTAPAGATSLGMYLPNGTFTDFGNTTGGPYTGNLPSSPTSGQAFPALIVAKDANGVFGSGHLNNNIFPFFTFNSSGNFTVPAGVTHIDIAVSGAGGGGGHGTKVNNSHGGGAGGGGGGRVITATTHAVSGVIPITIGAAGVKSSTTVAATSGGTTSFGADFSAAGGGRGGTLNLATPLTGSSGGGGSGSDNRVSPQSGAAGTAGQGFAGGNGVGDASYNGGPGGGGGGAGAVGAAGIGGTGVGGAGGAGVSFFTLTFGGGGGGGGAVFGGANGATVGTLGSGGRGGSGSGGGLTGVDGSAGVVMIKVLL